MPCMMPRRVRPVNGRSGAGGGDRSRWLERRRLAIAIAIAIALAIALALALAFALEVAEAEALGKAAQRPGGPPVPAAQEAHRGRHDEDTDDRGVDGHG